MKEKVLLKIALVISLVGLFMLFMISSEITVEEKTIDKINKDNIDETVKLQGYVSSVKDTDSVLIFSVAQENEIDIVVFKNGEEISLNEGDYVEVEGTIEEYNGEMEIIGEEIKVIE